MALARWLLTDENLGTRTSYKKFNLDSPCVTPSKEIWMLSVKGLRVLFRSIAWISLTRHVPLRRTGKWLRQPLLTLPSNLKTPQLTKEPPQCPAVTT